jgi:hypothetical protein
MMAWLMRRVKWALWLMAAAPFLFLGFLLADMFYFYPQKRNVFDKGIETVATVEGGTRSKRRRSGTSFSLDLSWTDKAGKPRTEKVSISRDLADKLIQNEVLVVDKLKIKYLDNDLDAPTLVLADMPATGPAAPEGPAMALALLPISFIGGGILYFMRRRERRAEVA